MRKIFMVVAVATLSFTFVACGGEKKTDAGTATDSTTIATEQVVKTADTEVKESTESTLFSKYETLMNEYIELTPKFKAGDATAVARVQELSLEMNGMAEELTKQLQNLSPADQAKFAVLGEKMTKAFQAAQ